MIHTTSFTINANDSGFTSMVMTPDHPELTFTLEHMRSEPTFQQPRQEWQFVSDYAVRDYSGLYHVKLIPCTVTEDVQYSNPPQCNPRDPVPFDLSVRFQQVSDPVPAQYSLNTHLHLMRKRDLWLSNGSMGFGEENDASFLPGDTVYGRVMMDPTQNLGESFFVNVEKCFLCAGVDGYVPKYDPEKNEYGCVADSENLLHSFKIIDKGAPQSITKEFRNVPFNAILASDDLHKDVEILKRQPSSDGFHFDSAPLFQVSYGRQWFVHCIYTVRSKEHAGRSIGKRSIRQHSYYNTRTSQSLDLATEIGRNGRGTNMNHIILDYTGRRRSRDSGIKPNHQSHPVSNSDSPAFVIVFGAVASLLIIAITALLISRRKSSNYPPSYAPTVVRASPGQTRIVSTGRYCASDDLTEV